MKKMLRAKFAGHLLIGLLTLLATVHVLVLFQIVPSEAILGRQTDGKYLASFVLIYLFVIAIFIALVVLKTRSLQLGKPAPRMIDTGLWILLVYAALTLGSNLVTRSALENIYLAPFTLIFILLVYRLTVEE